MRRLLAGAALLAALLLSAFSPVARGEITVPAEGRVPNKSPGYCAWCSLQTLASVLADEYPDDKGLQKARDLVNVRGREPASDSYIKGPGGTFIRVKGDPGGATPDNVRDQLRRMGIAFKEKPDDRSHDVDFLRACCDRGHGAMIGMVGWPSPDGAHAIAVVDVSAEKVEFKKPGQPAVTDYAVHFIDSNDHTKTYRASLTWVKRYWSGWTVAFDPQGRRVGGRGKADGGKADGGRADLPVIPPARPAAVPTLVEALMSSGLSREQAEAAAARLDGPALPPPALPPAAPGKD